MTIRLAFLTLIAVLQAGCATGQHEVVTRSEPNTVPPTGITRGTEARSMKSPPPQRNRGMNDLAPTHLDKEKEIAELEEERGELLTRFTEKHPDVLHITRRLAELRDPQIEERKPALGPMSPIRPRELRSGRRKAKSPATAPFIIPKPGNQEELIGSLSYPAPTAIAFDSRNRPYMFQSRDPEGFGEILTLRQGEWNRISYMQALRRAYPNLVLPSKRDLHAPGTITIDDADGLYALISIKKTPKRTGYALLYSPNLGEDFQVYDLKGKAFLEIRVGHNELSVPPAIGLLSKRMSYPTKWTDYHVFSVLLPVKEGDHLRLPKPVPITDDSFGISNHSGGYSFAVTIGNKTHLVYAEIPKQPGGGNPTYAATLDRTSGKLVVKNHLVNANPKRADVHATPVITADGEGYLHVLSGAHNGHFLFLSSLQPGDISSGWTPPARTGNRQTYATLVCDGQNRFHSVSRVHPTLVYQTSGARAIYWSKPTPVVRAPIGYKDYTIFYHRLFIDRADALYLSFTFYDGGKEQKSRYPRALAASEDGGRTWKLATKDSFLHRVR